MSSSAGSWIVHILIRIPGLYKKQPCGNYHPFWHRLCFCREHEYSNDWKGGILDLKTGDAYYRDVDALTPTVRGAGAGNKD